MSNIDLTALALSTSFGSLAPGLSLPTQGTAAGDWPNDLELAAVNAATFASPGLNFAAVLAQLIPPVGNNPSPTNPEIVVPTVPWSATVPTVLTQHSMTLPHGQNAVPTVTPPTFPMLSNSLEGADSSTVDPSATAAAVPVEIPISLDEGMPRSSPTSAETAGQGSAMIPQESLSDQKVVEAGQRSLPSNKPTAGSGTRLTVAATKVAETEQRMKHGVDIPTLTFSATRRLPTRDHSEVAPVLLAPRSSNFESLSRPIMVGSVTTDSIRGDSHELSNFARTELSSIGPVRLLRMLQVAQNEILVQLDPPSLGEVRIHLQGSAEGLRGEIQVARADVQAILESRLTELTRELQGRGLQVAQLAVAPRLETERETWFRSRPELPEVGESIGSTPIRRVQEISGSGGLDVRA
ncbi:MAG: flagellar hook-length control protein FliK [Gemmataceae bacterium]|nr:flagellar hook-length control protein FliK [Gemmataceae bacterium]